ncbi:hypothetical protein FSARC_3627 [Fusarium sarcochroum]|uniref:Uncharacterized protein n=1 Tax=Fusarium sarcochroum TaxID=1208366 RepID=A0A8H4XC85_9HYPO|nr:hypothetical protein FSARC_3627 [Fusarium sarcochroum]
MWAPNLNIIQQDVDNILDEIQDQRTRRNLDSIYVPVNIVHSLQKANRRLGESISCDLDHAAVSDKLDKFLQVIEEKPISHFYRDEDEVKGWWTMIYRLFTHPKHHALVARSTDLLSLLQELHEPRERLWDETNHALQRGLDKIIHGSCYASVQLERHAREAKTFGWPTLELFQKAALSAYLLCQESRNDAQPLQDLLDLMGVEIAAVETIIRNVKSLLVDIEKNKAMPEIQIDTYEGELMLIGRATMEMLDGYFTLPRAT